MKQPLYDEDADRVAIEKKLGMKFEVPFFVNKNITMTPNGYEGPYIDINGESWQEEEIKVLYWALFKALQWCQEGWAPGAC